MFYRRYRGGDSLFIGHFNHVVTHAVGRDPFSARRAESLADALCKNI